MTNGFLLTLLGGLSMDFRFLLCSIPTTNQAREDDSPTLTCQLASWTTIHKGRTSVRGRVNYHPATPPVIPSPEPFRRFRRPTPRITNLTISRFASYPSSHPTATENTASSRAGSPDSHPHLQMALMMPKGVDAPLCTSVTGCPRSI